MSLRRFIAQRILVSIPVLLGVSVITFGLVHLAPTDVVDIIIGLDPDATAADKAQLRAELGYDRPIYVQYIDWLTSALQGDFGEVYTRGQTAGELIASRWQETVLLGLFGWTFALLIAIPTGIYAAVRKGKFGDDAARFVALTGISIPNFWLGLTLLALFAVQFNFWSASVPRAPLWSAEMLKWLILPGITIGSAAAANLMRIMRTSMVEELNKEYVTAARAKGLPERTVVLKHVLRNSLISVVTVAAFLTAGIVAGSVVVESVFGWPGLGILLVEAATKQEINLILAITLFTGVAIVLANLLADILYAVLDPRIRDEY
ncbi:ABC transporter permease [Halovenus sp. HT40]|uniref:ABC transporter permease n=1 Tax=Halovenus sp. HT40 TaxID=3126691 RepID=UPI00300E95E9